MKNKIKMPKFGGGEPVWNPSPAVYKHIKGWEGRDFAGQLYDQKVKEYQAIALKYGITDQGINDALFSIYYNISPKSFNTWFGNNILNYVNNPSIDTLDVLRNSMANRHMYMNPTLLKKYGKGILRRAKADVGLMNATYEAMKQAASEQAAQQGATVVVPVEQPIPQFDDGKAEGLLYSTDADLFISDFSLYPKFSTPHQFNQTDQAFIDDFNWRYSQQHPGFDANQTQYVLQNTPMFDGSVGLSKGGWYRPGVEDYGRVKGYIKANPSIPGALLHEQRHALEYNGMDVNDTEQQLLDAAYPDETLWNMDEKKLALNAGIRSAISAENGGVIKDDLNKVIDGMSPTALYRALLSNGYTGTMLDYNSFIKNINRHKAIKKALKDVAKINRSYNHNIEYA